MTSDTVSRVVWLGYPAIIVFAIFAMAVGSPGTTIVEAAMEVLIGPLAFGGGLGLLALSLVVLGLAKPKNPVAVATGCVGIVLWAFLATIAHGLRMD